MNALSARTVWFEAPGVASVRVERLVPPGAGEVLVRGLVSGISAGTERVVLLGGVPAAIRASMALPAMRGGFELPVAYGYAVVGEVLAVGPEALGWSPGDRVLAMHPHQDVLIARAGELRPLPHGIPAPRLVLAPNLETAINVIWDAEVGLGDRVIVVGLGVVGLLVTWLMRKAGAADIRAVDPSPERRALAERLGATHSTPSVPAVDADVIVEASGSADALNALLSGAGLEARIVVASWYGATPAPLALGGAFHPNRVTLRSSQVGQLPPRKRARWTVERRWALVQELLTAPELDQLLAKAVPLDEAPAVYAELAAGRRWDPPQRVLMLSAERLAAG